MRDPRKQFEAFIKFVKSNTSLHIAMKNNDYTRIAYYYN
ncbi:MAG: N-acetylmuramidase domain-containing protein [Candidatus Peribacteria bacterium]|nr:N-acetylmuramidase domain-containing protein [Candidatus Peribacteria bacterium]